MRIFLALWEPPQPLFLLVSEFLCFLHTLTLLSPPLGIGAAYGTAKSGVGIATMGVAKPELVMKCLIPAIMAGILGIYGIVVSVTINSKSMHMFHCGKWPQLPLIYHA